MKRFLSAIRRLWLLATCTHRNMCMSIVWENTTDLTICRRCGLVVRLSNEHDDKYNPHFSYTEIGKR